MCPKIARQNEPPHDKTNKMSVRPVKTQISLGIRPVWSGSSLCAQWVAKDLNFLHADSEDTDQTGRMPRLIWVFAGRTLILLFCHVTAQINDGINILPDKSQTTSEAYKSAVTLNQGEAVLFDNSAAA